MGGIFKTPKAPAPPKLVMPDPSDTPDYEDETRRREVEEDERRRDRKRKGRRSTILSDKDLTQIEDENIDKKTLLGG